MAVLKKVFGGLNMSWPVVIVFAVVAGLFTGAMAMLPGVGKDCSFHDIAVSYECWVIFEFIIACNCQKNWECMLKTFAFFLISQPLVYLLQVGVGFLDPQLAWNYYFGIWGRATLLTLPGGFLAFYIKKQNVFGSIVLGLGCAIQGLMGVSYIARMLQNPPFHLLTIILCFASIFVFAFAIQESRRNRAIVLGVAFVVVAGLVALCLATGRVLA